MDAGRNALDRPSRRREGFGLFAAIQGAAVVAEAYSPGGTDHFDLLLGHGRGLGAADVKAPHALGKVDVPVGPRLSGRHVTAIAAVLGVLGVSFLQLGHHPLGLCARVVANRIEGVSAVAEEHGAGAGECADDVLHRADDAAIDDGFFGVSPQGHKAPGVIDRQGGAVGVASGDHAVGVGEVGRQRLFAEDALGPGVGRIDDQVGVAVVRGGDGDDVQRFAGEHLAVVAV